MQLNKDAAAARIAALGIDDIPLMEITPGACALMPDWFIQYKKLAKRFMESLTDSVEDLAFMNLAQDDFMGLVMGQRLPPNVSLRFRIPLMFGGKMEIDNMFMCHTFPQSHIMDRFIIEQTGAPTIWLPNPKHKIYIPTNRGGGGDGGNATEDRLSQIAAQISAGMEI